MKTCQNVKALAKEPGVGRQQLYCWKQQAERRRKTSDPRATEDPCDRRIRELEKKVGELEGVIGQRTLELDFFSPVPCEPASTDTGRRRLPRRRRADRLRSAPSARRQRLPRSRAGILRRRPRPLYSAASRYWCGANGRRSAIAFTGTAASRYWCGAVRWPYLVIARSFMSYWT